MYVMERIRDFVTTSSQIIYVKLHTSLTPVLSNSLKGHQSFDDSLLHLSDTFVSGQTEVSGTRKVKEGSESGEENLSS